MAQVVNRARLWQHPPMNPGIKALLSLGLLAAVLSAARADVVTFAPADGAADRELVVYSTLDTRLVAPLVTAFQARNPGVAVRYEDLLAGEIAARVVAETDAGGPTADVAFSSAMDQQMKLANDGYAQSVTLAEAARWPRWANWRDTAFAVTFEPAVLVYHKPSFPDGPPESRLELIDWLGRQDGGTGARIGTYDIEVSAVGYLYLARDEEHFADIWSLVAAMARAGLQTFPTSQDVIDRVADGRLAIGYNILGSYADDQALRQPDLGVVLLRDFTVVVSRVALVPRAAQSPDLGAAFLSFLLSREGQTLLARDLRLPAVNPEVTDATSAGALVARMGDQLRPVPVSPGLLAYLDQAKRRRMIAKWHAALAGR